MLPRASSLLLLSRSFSYRRSADLKEDSDRGCAHAGNADRLWNGRTGQVRPAQVSPDTWQQLLSARVQREDSLFSNASITGFYCEGAIARHLILEEMQYLYLYYCSIYTGTIAVLIALILQY